MDLISEIRSIWSTLPGQNRGPYIQNPVSQKFWARTEPYLDPLCGEGRAGDGRAAAEGLELGVHDLSIVVDFDLFSEHTVKINFSKLLSQNSNT